MAGDPPAGAAGPGVRLGHLRRGRLEPRPHDPHHRPDRHRHHAGADGAPDRRVALGRRAAARDRRLRRRRHPNILAVRGDPPGDPLGEWVAAPRGPDATPTSSSGWCGSSATSASASRRSRTATRARPTRTRTCSSCSPRSGRAPTSRSRQLFLEPDGFLRLRDRLAAAGLRRPAPARDHAAALRCAPCAAGPELSGAPVPAGARGAAGAATPTTRWRSAPRAWTRPRELCARLLAEGVPGLHFYTLNRSTATAELVRALGLAPAHRGLAGVSGSAG